MIVEKPSNGPCYTPLYTLKRSKNFDEQSVVHQNMFSWADLVYDFRVQPVQETQPLPEELGPEYRVIEWGSSFDGWIADGFFTDIDAFDDTKTRDVVSILRFIDPHGFKFAFVVTLDRKKGNYRFARARFGELLPGFAQMFVTNPSTFRKTRNNSKAVEWEMYRPNGTTLPSTDLLENVRDAAINPAGWFGDVDWSDKIFSNPWSSVHADRAMFDWASNGYSYQDAAVWLNAGMSSTETKAWLKFNQPSFDPDYDADYSETDDTEPVYQHLSPCGEKLYTNQDIVDWFTVVGGGNQRRNSANAYRRDGMRSDQYEWVLRLGSSISSTKPLIKLANKCEKFSWSIEDAIKVNDAIVQPEKNQKPMIFSNISEWFFASPNRVIDYIHAGIQPEEAERFESSSEPPTKEILALMSQIKTN